MRRTFLIIALGALVAPATSYAGAALRSIAPSSSCSSCHGRRLAVAMGAAAGRRHVVFSVAAAAAAAALPAARPARANTEAMLDKPMDGFDSGEEKRAAFLKKQKAFKKSWRKELQNLEFADNDAEFVAATDALYKMITSNGFEIPEGVRKMDLDQVYKTVQNKDILSKNSRMEYQKLNKIVMDITTVKSLQGMSELGY